MGAELKEQTACSLKTRRAPKHDAMDFRANHGESVKHDATIHRCSIQGL